LIRIEEENVEKAHARATAESSKFVQQIMQGSGMNQQPQPQMAQQEASF